LSNAAGIDGGAVALVSLEMCEANSETR